MNRRSVIDALQKGLERLTLASRNICRAIESLKIQERSPESCKLSPDPCARLVQKSSQATDRNGKIIHVGDRIIFLVKGKFKSTEGIVSQFWVNKEYVFAVDSDRKEIPRAPCNVHILNIDQ